MRGKPTLIKLTDKQGNLKSPYWYIRYRDGQTPCRETTGCRIGEEDDEAQIYLATWILERERPIAREPDKLMVAQALKDYYHEHGQYIATAKNCAYHEKRLLGHFGHHFVAQVTQAGVNAYVRACQDRNESNGTIRRDLEHLKASLNHEVREQRLIYAPKFRMPPPPPSRNKSLGEKEIKAIASACKSQHVEDFTYLMFDTGQRPGAIEKLKWFQVDFKADKGKGIINFDLVERHGRIMERAQSNKRVRAVPMSERVRRILKRLFKVKTTEFVLEYVDPITHKVRPAGCVKKAFARACKNAGVDASRYTLRHAFANREMDELTRMQFMGHTKVSTSREHYIKINIPKMRDALKRGKNEAKVKRSKS